jgi:N-acetylmuramoyl-L-alanine amidase
MTHRRDDVGANSRRTWKTAGIALVVVGSLLVSGIDLRRDVQPEVVAAGSTPISVVVTPGPGSTLPSTTSSTSTIPAPPPTLPTKPQPYGAPEVVERSPEPPLSGIQEGFLGRGVVTIAAGGAPLSNTVGGEVFVTAREGLVLAAQGYSIDRSHVWVYTSCDAYAWVPVDGVFAQPSAPKHGGELLASMAEATVVIDPGHGGPWNNGAAGRGRTYEKDVNLAIAQRVRDLLTGSRTVDWETGEIFLGGEIPAAGWVLVTRVGDGEEADYEAGLRFRSTLANAANADAMVSIHNNAGINSRLKESGSDVYYQSQLEESRRFSEIMVEEFARSFAPFEANWVGDPRHGAVSRISARDGVSQYYGVLRRTEIPTVLAEGAYLSNPTEAALLATPDFQQAYANAVYRAIVRFLTTDDAPSVTSLDPVRWKGVASNGNARGDCEVPAQPVEPGVDRIDGHD